MITIKVLGQRILAPSYKLSTIRLCSSTTKSSNSVDNEDILRHGRLAKDWWNPYGPMKALHSMNRIRVPFIRNGLIGVGRVDPKLINTTQSLKGIHILEVGCGAGILTESLARIHAQMTSIDPGHEVIETAKEHLKNAEFAERIDYRVETIEDHVNLNPNKYDAVVVSEVLEHVNEKPAFLKSCLGTLKPGGSIFITTFNKTCLSWMGGIVVAEYLTALVPKGTHDWNSFIPPNETERILRENNCSLVLVNGFLYEFWRDEWIWTDNDKLSYAMHAVKNV